MLQPAGPVIRSSAEVEGMSSPSDTTGRSLLTRLSNKYSYLKKFPGSEVFVTVNDVVNSADATPGKTKLAPITIAINCIAFFWYRIIEEILTGL